MHIDIRLENEKTLWLDADAVIEWVRENMFFERDVKLRGQYTYPFSVNRTKNSEALGFPDVIEAQFQAESVGCVIYFKGNFFYKGQINVLDWDDERIYISVGRNKKQFDGEKYLDEMALPIFEDICDYATRNTERTLGYPDRAYCFPQYYNVNEDSLEKFGTSSGNYNIINWQQGNSENANGEEVVSPMFFWLSVLSEALKTFKFTMRSNLVNVDYFKKKVLFNPVVPSLATNTYESAIWKTAVFEDGLHVNCMRLKSELNIPVNTEYKVRVVEWKDSTIVNQTNVTYTVSALDIAGGTSQIMQSFKAAINSAVSNLIFYQERYTGGISSPFNGYGFKIKYNNGNKIALLNHSDNITNPNQLWGVGARRGGWSNPYKDEQTEVECSIKTFLYNDVQMAKHMPHITFSDFLNTSKDFFNLMISVDETNDELVVKQRKDEIDFSNIQDMTPFLLRQEEGRVDEEPNWVLEFDNDEGNDPLTETLPKRATNYEEANQAPFDVIGVGAGVLYQEELRNSNSGLRVQPKSDIALSDYDNIGSFGLRFLHVYGYVADSNGKKSVFADDLGLTPDELYTLHYKDWHELMKRMPRESTFYFDFGFNELKNILPTLWKAKHNLYAWKRITTYLHNTKGIMPSKVDLYKL